MTGIEPALSAWEPLRSRRLEPLTWSLGVPQVTVIDPLQGFINPDPADAALTQDVPGCSFARTARKVRQAVSRERVPRLQEGSGEPRGSPDAYAYPRHATNSTLTRREVDSASTS